MHSTVGVHPSLVVRCIVIPCNTEHLTEVVVEISEGRVGVHLELKLDVTISVHKNESWLDVQCAKINSLSDLDQVSQGDAALCK